MTNNTCKKSFPNPGRRVQIWVFTPSLEGKQITMPEESIVLCAIHAEREFKIREDANVGFYVYVFDGDICTHDYLQDSLDKAKAFALETFGVPINKWAIDSK